MPKFGTDPNDEYGEMSRTFNDTAIEWQKARVRGRRNEVTNETKLDYSAIRFPDPAGCRHAALVVCASARDYEDAKALLEALALPTILREGGGDGRVLRVQRGAVRLGDEAPKPVGYNADDWGQPAKKKGKPHA